MQFEYVFDFLHWCPLLPGVRKDNLFAQIWLIVLMALLLGLLGRVFPSSSFVCGDVSCPRGSIRHSSLQRERGNNADKPTSHLQQPVAWPPGLLASSEGSPMPKSYTVQPTGKQTSSHSKFTFQAAK
ncbi:unnamed protein product [Ilex paraguariensis]|uniref:Uncharacterized protein n=1 Tax=Ilex paraguariensis TaxID=185542 RepID=A0ABC8R369_9AQUA